MVLGQNWERMLAFTERYESLVLVVLAAMVLVWFGRTLAQFRLQRQRLGSSPRPSTIRAAAVPITAQDEPRHPVAQYGAENFDDSHDL